MRVAILGGGWYGCHLARSLAKHHHQTELFETSSELFAGASGGNPGRLHLGFHYPRSKLTRAMCQETHRAFMREYGHLTACVPINIYAVAADDSKVDWGNYRQVLRGEVDFVELERPTELGLREVEGAMLTGERHIVIRHARDFFSRELAGRAHFNVSPELVFPDFDQVIDCTFCSRENERVDRYEVCLTGLLEGPTDRAVTIMDGPFPSLYPWDEGQRLNSLTSAKWTPLARSTSHAEARHMLATMNPDVIRQHLIEMQAQLATYWPDSRDLYRWVDERVRIRAMPRSAADARLVDVVRIDPRTLRIRAGKIDAVMAAEQIVLEALCSL